MLKLHGGRPKMLVHSMKAVPNDRNQRETETRAGQGVAYTQLPSAQNGHRHLTWEKRHKAMHRQREHSKKSRERQTADERPGNFQNLALSA